MDHHHRSGAAGRSAYWLVKKLAPHVPALGGLTELEAATTIRALTVGRHPIPRQRVQVNAPVV